MQRFLPEWTRSECGQIHIDIMSQRKAISTHKCSGFCNKGVFGRYLRFHWLKFMSAACGGLELAGAASRRFIRHSSACRVYWPGDRDPPPLFHHLTRGWKLFPNLFVLQAYRDLSWNFIQFMWTKYVNCITIITCYTCPKCNIVKGFLKAYRTNLLITLKLVYNKRVSF